MWHLVIFGVITLGVKFCSAYPDSDSVLSDLQSGTDYKDVVTQSGVVRGWAASDGSYYAFLGIPYAAPPTRTNRFKSPLPPVPWTGVFEANRKVMCPQNGQGDEDCLILNVFTPTMIHNGPLPVLVYIHGGSFLLGAGQTEGVEPLMKQNVIVVTINYRLGALGFLCLGIEEAPGNAGLKDQAAALKWVQHNIVNFGGDIKQVTLHGMSAGATSTEFQILSKMGKGLFQKAIIESGAAAAVWATDLDPIGTAVKISEHLDFPTKNMSIDMLVDFYVNQPADKLSAVNYEYYKNLTDGTFGFVPCVERRLDGIEPFITESPHDILTKQAFTKVPVMFVFAALEGLFLRSDEYNASNYKHRMETNFLDFVPADLVFDTQEIIDEKAESIKQFYFGNQTVAENCIVNYLNYFGDYLVMDGLLNSAEIHSIDNNPVYVIEFEYKGKLGSYDEGYDNLNLAGHGDFIKYAILNKSITNNEDQLAVDRVSKIIGNFVKFAAPIPEKTSLLPIMWPEVESGNLIYLKLNKDLKVLEKPYRDRKMFWDQLYIQFRRKINPVDPSLL